MRPKQKRLLARKQREEALKAAEVPTEQEETSVEPEPEPKVSPKTKLSKEPEKTEKKDTPSKAKMPRVK